MTLYWCAAQQNQFVFLVVVILSKLLHFSFRLGASTAEEKTEKMGVRGLESFVREEIPGGYEKIDIIPEIVYYKQ